jgi:hypothetical protein
VKEVLEVEEESICPKIKNERGLKKENPSEKNFLKKTRNVKEKTLGPTKP